MTPEQLKQGLDLEATIKQMKNHIRSIKMIQHCRRLKDGFPEIIVDEFYVEPNALNNYASEERIRPVTLIDSLFNKEEFLMLYLIRAEKRLKEIQNEFDNL